VWDSLGYHHDSLWESLDSVQKSLDSVHEVELAKDLCKLEIVGGLRELELDLAGGLWKKIFFDWAGLYTISFFNCLNLAQLVTCF
jgi:hypothetical protein